MRSQRAIANEGDDMTIRTKLIGTIVVGAALLVPVAQARPDDEAGPRGPGAIAAEKTFVQGVTDFPSSAGVDIRQITGAPTSADGKVGLLPSTNVRLVRHPDNRADRSGPGYDATVGDVTAVGHPDNRAERYGPGFEGSEYAYRGMLPSDYGQPNAIVAVERPGAGFDWGDGLIGGLGGAGLALLLTGSAFLILNQRNKVRTV
jgi:hypothetical protein